MNEAQKRFECVVRYRREVESIRHALEHTLEAVRRLEQDIKFEVREAERQLPIEHPSQVVAP